MPTEKQPQPDHSKGEYLDENDKIKVCKACLPSPTSRRHTCGLSGLQGLMRF